MSWVYQLFCRGTSQAGGWPFRMHSRMVYREMDKAEEAKPAFLERCADGDTHFDYVDLDEPVEVSVLELELVE